ncbi:MAG: hypothetical protein RBR74_13475 [Ignavibacteriaceae bacterium]|nr:hypothetical protein [Ignavibacteriaceae bacterium]
MGWHKVKWVSDGTAESIYVDDVLMAGTVAGNGSGGEWFADVLALGGAFERITVGAFYCNILYGSVSGKIKWVNYSDKSKWYLTGQGLYEYDSNGIHDLTYVGNPIPVYDQLGSTHLLDNGYSVFKKDAQKNEYVPNLVSNTPIATPSLLSTYTRYVDRNGSAAKHNLAPCLIDFDSEGNGLLTNYDRSDTTIFEDAARAGSDYDVTHPFRWRAEDIADPTVYYNWLKVGYKDKLLSRITQEDMIILTLDEILSLK